MLSAVQLIVIILSAVTLGGIQLIILITIAIILIVTKLIVFIILSFVMLSVVRTRGRIFSCVQPFYEQAVSDLDP